MTKLSKNMKSYLINLFDSGPQIPWFYGPAYRTRLALLKRGLVIEIDQTHGPTLVDLTDAGRSAITELNR